MTHSTLSLHGLRCSVQLGCESAERAVPQSVLFDVWIRFPELSPSCMTDELSDTVCYAKVSEWIRSVCARGEFKLIERLGYEAYTLIKKNIPPDHALKLVLTKELPPVPDLTGGSRFTLSDWPENGSTD